MAFAEKSVQNSSGAHERCQAEETEKPNSISAGWPPTVLQCVPQGPHRSPLDSVTLPWRNAARWWHLGRHHRPSQFAMRLLRVLHNHSGRKLWFARMERPQDELPSLRLDAGLAALSRRKLAQRGGREESRTQGERIRRGRFCFLQRTITLSDPFDWRVKGTEVSQLWRFHLHYHDYLLDLAAQGVYRRERHWVEKAWAMVLDWIGANRLNDPRVLGDAWHPYCISRRLPVWIHLWAAGPPTPGDRRRVLGSMLWQTRYLERHLEWDLGGNHLLENFRALTLMGIFFEGPDACRWLRKTATWLPRQLGEQILPDGEHFERSPRYHADVLEALLDVREAAAPVNPDLARLCNDTAARMAEFLRAILHPDGEFPLLGDSCFNPAHPTLHLLEQARGKGTAKMHAARRIGSRMSRRTAARGAGGSVTGAHLGRCAPPLLTSAANASSEAAPSGGGVVSDYWVYRHAGDFLLFDAGTVGADHLPAHAHADLLTLEASIEGRRLLVDSGVFSYDDEPMRRYCRSTAAHNVLQIDRTDHCDMWSRFRMGYRGRPSGLEAGREHGFSWARASHNAYRRLGVPHIGRWLACRPGGPWFCVDWARGGGRHRLTSWLHFHPSVVVRPLGARTLQLQHAGRLFQLCWLTPGQTTVEEGWYCPQLGRREKAPVVRWEAVQPLPAACGWCLTWNGDKGNASLADTTSGETVIRWTDEAGSMEFLLPRAI